jgi:hypothetical protein
LFGALYASLLYYLPPAGYLIFNVQFNSKETRVCGIGCYSPLLLTSHGGYSLAVWWRSSFNVTRQILAGLLLTYNSSGAFACFYVAFVVALVLL